MEKIYEVPEIIRIMGGSTKVAADLGYDKEGGSQRVNNWRARGIPYKVLYHNQKYFDKARRLLNN